MLFRRPLREIASWPAWEVRLLEHYLAKQPAADERVEVAVATLIAAYANAHLKDGSTQKNPRDFMPYLINPWEQAEAVEELNEDLKRI